MRKTALIVIMSLSLTNCGLIQQHMQNNQPLASESPRPEVNIEMALVHFYRVGNQHAENIGSVNIYANSEYIFGANNNGYTWFYLKPGSYKFKAEWSIMDKPLFESGLYDTKYHEIYLEENKEYYLNYRVNEVPSSGYDEASKVIGIAAKIAEPRSIEASVEIVQESKKDSISSINKCRLQTNQINNKI